MIRDTTPRPWSVICTVMTLRSERLRFLTTKPRSTMRSTIPVAAALVTPTLLARAVVVMSSSSR